MAEPENHTLRILQDIREVLRSHDKRFDKIDENFGSIRSRLDNIRQALNGESVLGRYAAAEVEERLEAIEARLANLEKA